jgi:7-keto-8-aminopelargonate synthetase-like enzyme
LVSDFESFYSRRMFHRIRDCWNRPITGVPGGKITVLERMSTDNNDTFIQTGKKLHLDNLSSYNYLGFAENDGVCSQTVLECLDSKLPVEVDSTRAEYGTTRLHLETEQAIAAFVGKPAAMIFGMGFGTNSTMIPALVSKGCLIISDELNHTSLVVGCRLSGATIRTFKHNDPKSLEAVLRESIAFGQERSHRPWKKILVIVEGLYSMEGTIVRLPEIIRLKHIYKVPKVLTL